MSKVLEGVRHAIVWVLHDPEATPVPASGVAELGSNSTQLGEDCSAIAVPDLDNGTAERVTLRSIEPAVILWSPAEQDQWSIVDERYADRPVLAKCRTLAEAETEARSLVPRRRAL